MLRITFLVGNGFDLQANLPTKPLDIIDDYLQAISRELSSKKPGTDPGSLSAELLSIIQSTITNDYESWGDFETALGSNLADACSKANIDPTQYAQTAEHFTRHLHAYISDINRRIDAFQITLELEEQFYRSAGRRYQTGLLLTSTPWSRSRPPRPRPSRSHPSL